MTPGLDRTAPLSLRIAHEARIKTYLPTLTAQIAHAAWTNKPAPRRTST